MNTVAHPLSDGSQPGSVRTSSPEPVQAAPFPNPHVSTSHSCGTSAMSAVTRVPPPLFDPAFLAAWRESQGTVVDPKPMSPLIDPEWPFTVNREGMIIDMRTGEIDEVLTAQFCMGIS